MTPKTRPNMESTLADHGLTVLKTTDHNAMLMQLARLQQFERLMLITAAGNTPVEHAVERVILTQMQGVQP